ncbi:MAG TPA: hypothetical protein VMM13_02600, partial [Euzebya sp.]|nr:hypothetical protein [Euzebya sp.]
MSVVPLQPAGLPATDLPVATSHRWQPLRAGVQNVWQYDHTTRFVFHHGRLLLRGRNGVGKTKVVEVLLPFLLEGRMEPARLDPFGTRSRKMRYNLLHEANTDAQTNVGYVWLELGRHDRDTDQPRYLTIGAGLKARRASDGVEAWFFVTEGRRVDADLDLLDTGHYPLARPALADQIGGDGHVYTAAQEYRHAVNRALYGVEDEQYEAMLDALLRLRQPHLSERLDPTSVATLLAQSLPPLDAERIREVAEGFERLEGHRRELADRCRAHDAVSGFMATYRGYAQAVLARASRLLTQSNSRRDKAAQEITAAEDAHAAALLDRTQLQEERQDLDRRHLAVTERQRTLEGSEAFKAVAELERAEHEAEVARQAQQKVAGRCEQEIRAAGTADQQRASANQAVEAMARELAEALREAAAQARRADLLEAHDTVHGLLQAPSAEGGAAKGAVIGAATAIRDQRKADVTTVRQAQERLADATLKRDVAGSRNDQATAQLDRAEGSLAVAEESLTGARTTFVDAVQDWR